MRSDINGNATRSSSSPRKEKTILGWLVKSASANNDKHCNSPIHNDNDKDSDNNNRNNCNCNCESRAFRDFRGVQTLRLLWSKRISSASEEAAAAQRLHSGTLRKLNKSVSCLVNAFNNARDWPSSLTNAHETRSKRAASLHNLHEAQLQQQQQQHKDKDNFYKYKNAEQAKMAAAANGTSNATFPAVKASENAAGSERFLQWPKREDVASKCKADKKQQQQLQEREQERQRDAERQREAERHREEERKGKSQGESVEESAVESGKLISSLNEQQQQQRPQVANSHRFSLGATSAQSGSSESLQTVNSLGSSRTHTARHGGATRRKYSFKTHAGKSFHQHHTPRRMSATHLHSLSVAAAGADGAAETVPSSASGGSLVRQLTQQFNDIISKDARLLQQVKRNNGVLLARGSHVYKIVEKPPAAETPSSPCNPPSTVQCNIKKFERLEKPLVPSKPLHWASLGTLKQQQQRLKRSSRLQLGKQLEMQLEVQQQRAQLVEQLEVEVKEEREQQLEVLAELNVDEGVHSEVDDAIKPKPQSLATAASATLTQSADVDKEGESAEAEAERQQRRKQKYATIYEKLRFLPFSKAGRRRAKGEKEEEQQMQVEEQQRQQQPQVEALQLPLQEANVDPQISPCLEADAKILDALDVLDRKLKVLSQPGCAQQDDVPATVELLVSPNDDFEQRLLPNNSFIYQAANKQISNNKLLLNQAVNVTLVNAIEGEQMIMEQKLLELPEQQQLLKETVEQEHQQEEPIYEPITTTMETKTEPQASILFKITNQKEKQKERHLEKQQEQENVQEKLVEQLKQREMHKLQQEQNKLQQDEEQQHQLEQEDIYQTVEEANAKPSWLEGYESIAGSCEAAANRSSKPEDDYEAFATPTATAPCINEEPATPMPHSTGTLGRNTRDELPELPKPQRKLPKSPIVLRPAPAKPAQEEEDENIYDTIKGCYESLAVQQQQQQRKHSCAQSSDGVSLGSNCYESISHYRKGRATGVAAGAGAAPGVAPTTAATGVQLSSSGSTLTISSDHRTNSLYESSLAAGLIYGSASVGCRSSVASSAGSAGRGKASDKRSSTAGSSDNSDAWVDISDTEATTAAAAPAGGGFIV